MPEGPLNLTVLETYLGRVALGRSRRAFPDGGVIRKFQAPSGLAPRSSLTENEEENKVQTYIPTCLEAALMGRLLVPQ